MASSLLYESLAILAEGGNMFMFKEELLQAGRNPFSENVATVAERHGLLPLTPPAIVEARGLAAALIGPGVASAARLVELQAHFPASIFGLRQDGALTGLLAAFPLNERGLDAVNSDAFDAVDLDLALVSRPLEAPSAYYGWGFAATTKDGARAVMRASLDIHATLYWAVPTFARAVTSDGARALQSIGFRPHENRPDLFSIAPATTPSDPAAVRA